MGVRKTIFWGKCWNCGEQGHSGKNCPKLGKGFLGKCWKCGKQGHSQDQCPEVNAVEEEKRAPEEETGMLDADDDLVGLCHMERNNGDCKCHRCEEYLCSVEDEHDTSGKR